MHLVTTLMRLLTSLLTEIDNSGKDDNESMSSQQVHSVCRHFVARFVKCLKISEFQVFLWLQGLFLFSLVWTIGGTIDGDGRQKFDHYFRTLISGTDNEHPKPKTSKLSKSNVFPERGGYHFIAFYRSLLFF